LLVWEPLLLSELIVQSRFSGLIRLLLNLAHLHLSLSGLHLSLLVCKAEVSYTLTALKAVIEHVVASALLKRSYLGSLPEHTLSGSLLELRLLGRHTIDVLAHTRCSLSCPEALRILLLTKPGNGLTLTDVLAIQSLTKCGLLLCGRHVLTKLLLPHGSGLLSTKLLRGAISLSCAKTKLLLLTSYTLSLTVALLEDVRQG
jgi:hypothetical protein